jgi:hypothetical protein
VAGGPISRTAFERGRQFAFDVSEALADGRDLADVDLDFEPGHYRLRMVRRDLAASICERNAPAASSTADLAMNWTSAAACAVSPLAIALTVCTIAAARSLQRHPMIRSPKRSAGGAPPAGRVPTRAFFGRTRQPCLSSPDRLAAQVGELVMSATTTPSWSPDEDRARSPDGAGLSANIVLLRTARA